MTSSIKAENVETVARFLKGKRLEKLLASIEIFRTAEERGSFAGRESQKALAGFGPGLVSGKKQGSPKGEFPADDRMAKHNAEMCLNYGYAYTGVPFSVDGVPQEVIEAWVQLCCAAHGLFKLLKDARPKPVVTAVGLSRKVTATLVEMNLEIDLPTIAPAEIEAYKVHARHPQTGEKLFKKDGVTPILETAYRVKWTKGIKLGQSRFYSGCEACGKPIPSGRYVAIEADCKRNGRIGLWIGCDCARNIFGVKDLGIAKEA
jgi:hypothetical protein